MSVQWEYMQLTEGTSPVAQAKMTEQLNEFGTIGWEVCGIAAVDRTVGLNTVTVTLKRQRAASFAPAETSGWHADPSGRFEQRYYDGLRWTEHVSTGGGQSKDWPVVG
jgi:Protein of unknown function (DUF2510)